MDNVNMVQNPVEEQAAKYSPDEVAKDSTIATQPSAAIETPTDAGQPQSNTPPTVATAQNPIGTNPAQQVEQQSQEGQQIQQGAMKMPSKESTVPAANMEGAVHPSVQRASWLRDVAQTLAGGPKYSYSVDANTGKMIKTETPLSGKEIGMAIALEALSGGLTGLAAGRGRGAGAAGAAAMQQQLRRGDETDKAARAEANANYARGASIAQTNMEMLRNEQITSQADEQFQQADIDRSAEEYQNALAVGAVKQQGLTSDQVKELVNKGDANVTKDMFIPYKIMSSEQKTIHGAPKFEKLYAQIDPEAVAHVDPKLWEEAQQYQLPGTVDGNGKPIPPPTNLEMKLRISAHLREQVRKYSMTDAAVEGYQKGYEHPLHSGTAPQSNTQGATSPDDTGTPTTTTGSPEIKDSVLAQIVDKAADDNGVPKDLMRSVALQEGSGRLNTPDSKPNSKGVYAVGPLQVTPQTAAQFTNPATNKPYTEAEIRDPKTNATVSALILRNLIKTNNGDTSEALKDYFGRGTDVNGMTSEQYVKQIMSRIPQTGTQPVPGAAATELPKLLSSVDAIKQGIISPKDMDTLQQLTGAANLLTGNWSTKDIQNMAEKNKNLNSDSVGRILNWMGPAIDAKYNQKEAAKQYQKDTNAVNRAKQIEDIKAQEQEKIEQQAAKLVSIPDDWKYDSSVLDMTPKDAAEMLRKKGVTVPDNFSDLLAMAKGDSKVELPTKVYKGVGGALGMTPTLGKTFIYNFLNPNWQEQTFAAKQRFIDQLHSDRPGDVGKVLDDTGTALNHINMLYDLIDNSPDGNFGSVNTKSPAWNSIVRFADVQTGASPEVVMRAYLEKIDKEVNKVASGQGAALESDMRDAKQTWSNISSSTQLKDVSKAYAHIMAGRLNPINNDALRDTNREVPIGPQVALSLLKHGEYAPSYGYAIWKDPVHETGLLGFSKNPHDPNAQMIPIDKLDAYGKQVISRYNLR